MRKAKYEGGKDRGKSASGESQGEGGGGRARGRQWVKKGAGLWLSLNWDTLRSVRLI